MGRQIVIHDDAFSKLCEIARMLKARNGTSPDFAAVIDYLLEACE